MDETVPALFTSRLAVAIQCACPNCFMLGPIELSDREVLALEPGVVDPGHARRMMQQFCRRASWSWHQLTTTIRANPSQDLLGTLGAECALERTNQGICGFGRQIFIATFTTGSQFKHRLFSSGEVAISGGQTTAATLHLKIGWQNYDLISAAGEVFVKIIIP